MAYFASWFERDDPGGPMWALNLMKYRAVAEYADGRETGLSGAEADEAYSPLGPLAEVGARVVLIAQVVHQLAGDGTVWDRIAMVQYPRRMAMIEMNQRDDFKELHEHKDAGMEFTIVMATFPAETDPAPDPALSGAASERLMLLQVVADAASPDVAEGIESERIGRFENMPVAIDHERC